MKTAFFFASILTDLAQGASAVAKAVPDPPCFRCNGGTPSSDCTKVGQGVQEEKCVACDDGTEPFNDKCYSKCKEDKYGERNQVYDLCTECPDEKHNCELEATSNGPIDPGHKTIIRGMCRKYNFADLTAIADPGRFTCNSECKFGQPENGCKACEDFDNFHQHCIVIGDSPYAAAGVCRDERQRGTDGIITGMAHCVLLRCTNVVPGGTQPLDLTGYKCYKAGRYGKCDKSKNCVPDPPVEPPVDVTLPPDPTTTSTVAPTTTTTVASTCADFPEADCGATMKKVTQEDKPCIGACDQGTCCEVAEKEKEEQEEEEVPLVEEKEEEEVVPTGTCADLPKHDCDAGQMREPDEKPCGDEGGCTPSVCCKAPGTCADFADMGYGISFPDDCTGVKKTVRALNTTVTCEAGDDVTIAATKLCVIDACCTDGSDDPDTTVPTSMKIGPLEARILFDASATTPSLKIAYARRVLHEVILLRVQEHCCTEATSWGATIELLDDDKTPPSKKGGLRRGLKTNTTESPAAAEGRVGFTFAATTTHEIEQEFEKHWSSMISSKGPFQTEEDALDPELKVGDKESPGLSQNTLIAIAVCGTIAGIIIIILLYCYFKRRSKKKEEKKTVAPSPSPGPQERPLIGSHPVPASNPNRQREREINWSDTPPKDKPARGSFFSSSPRSLNQTVEFLPTHAAPKSSPSDVPSAFLLPTERGDAQVLASHYTADNNTIPFGTSPRHNMVQGMGQDDFIAYVEENAKGNWSNVPIDALTSLSSRILRMQDLTPRETTRLIVALGGVGKQTQGEVSTREAFSSLQQQHLQKITKFDRKEHEAIVFAYGQRVVSPRGEEYLPTLLKALRENNLKPVKLGMSLELMEGRDREMMKTYAYGLLPLYPHQKATEMAYCVWLLEKLNLLNSSEVKVQLNNGFLASIERLGNPNRILEAGMPLLLSRVMTPDTMVMWLRSLAEKKLAIEGPDNTLVTTNLTQMMIAEMVIRFDYDNDMPFDPMVDKFLNQVRSLKLTPDTVDYLYELPFVFDPLDLQLKELQIKMEPIIIGPFYLRLCHPERKVVLEWDCNWEMYPIKTRFIMKDYALRKHRYLMHLGWTVLKMPLEPFRHGSSEGQRQLVYDFCRANNISGGH